MWHRLPCISHPMKLPSSQAPSSPSMAAGQFVNVVASPKSEAISSFSRFRRHDCHGNRAGTIRIMKHPIFDHFYKIGVIPVLEVDSASHARPLAESLLAGVLPIAEVTLRTDAAL